MKIPPQLPAPIIRRSVDQAGQKVLFPIHTGGNVNAFATSICVLIMTWVLPTSSLAPVFWVQAALFLFFFYCAGVYGYRAYEAFVEDYGARTTLAYANDESKVIDGADSRFATLSDLFETGMLTSTNERIVGAFEGYPVFTPPMTTFVKYVGMQGSGKTTGYVFTNILHLLNTKAHFTEAHDHQEGIEDDIDAVFDEVLDAGDWDEIRESTSNDDHDAFSLEGELFNAHDI